MEFLVAITSKVSEYTVGAICRQLGYVVFYRYNMKGLKKQVDILVNTRNKVQHSIDESIYKAEEIEDLVVTWMTEVNEISEKAHMLMTEAEEPKQNCWNDLHFNFVRRHRLSRKAKRMTNEVDMIRGRGNFDKVYYCGPLPDIENAGYLSFESRRSTMREVQEALEHPDVNRIGVYGMGGIGKTMLVKEIARYVKKENLFGVVIMAIVGQNINVRNIQGQLGDMLGLKYDQESEQGRASRLLRRLRKVKKILIILDDIWDGLDLEAIGIPCRDDCKGCKILVTSRSERVLSSVMNIQKNFKVNDLSTDEAWGIFNKIVGESIEIDHELHEVATKVVDECGKLPIAIVTVAKALKGKELCIWKEALRQLKNPTTVDIEGVSDQVFASLKLSYDYLSSEDAKNLFLLCSMFPDDHNICKDDFIRYNMGMKLVQGVHTLETTRNRILKLVDDLKSCCLLQSSERGDAYVKMHDVIRDVAIHIASKDDRICTLCYGKELDKWRDEDTHGRYTVIFVNCSKLQNLPQKLSFPKLEVLALVKINYVQIPEAFFEGMEKLKVLHLEEMRLSPTRPSFHCFVNLRTLILNRCQLGNISEIIELKNLEVLDLSYSDIMELPLSISQLTQLKQLNLSYCLLLEVIPRGVISRLTQLEALHIFHSFKRWELDNNASVLELEHLSCLTHLDLCIPNFKYLPKKAFSKNMGLESFHINIGNYLPYIHSYQRAFGMKMDSISAFLGEGVNMVLHKSEYLNLEGAIGVKDVLLELNKRDIPPKLMDLSLENNADVEYLVSEYDTGLSGKAFSKLMYLSLENMMGLHTIFQGLQKTSKAFEKLKILEVRKCGKLKYLFSLSIMESLSNLEEIDVFNCEAMEAIVAVENDEAVDKIECKSLRRMDLDDLPRLMGFYCKLPKRVSPQSNEDPEISEDTQLIANVDCQLSFPKLRDLNVAGLHNRLWCDEVVANNPGIKSNIHPSLHSG